MFSLNYISTFVSKFWGPGHLVKSDDLINYSLVNDQIIPAQGNAYSGQSYLYIDNNVLPGSVYHYWLVDVDIHGAYKIHGPVKTTTYLERGK